MTKGHYEVEEVEEEGMSEQEEIVKDNNIYYYQRTMEERRKEGRKNVGWRVYQLSYWIHMQITQSAFRN